MHDALAHGGGDQGLQHAEDTGEDGAEDHAEGEQAQQARAPLGDGDVEDLPEQEGRGDRHQGRGADQQADDREAAAVGAEQLEDAAHLPGLFLGVGRCGPGGFAIGVHGLLRRRRGESREARDGRLTWPAADVRGPYGS